MTVSYASSSKGTSPEAPPKPHLRGWLHLGMAPAIQAAGLVLLILAPTVLGRLGVGIYLVSASILFGMSALYHRGTWSERAAAVLRRFDHANIFIFIAGTYTPLALMLLHLPQAALLLALIWGIAALGITFKLLWMTAPRWLYTGLYLAMGWVAVGWLVPFWNAGGPLVVILIAAGGLVYSVGALIYARKLPNPSPTWFGFHEIFHACTVVAAGLHFAAIALVVLT
ncbi:MAG: PAQR family membrane homeostasis protein TrhA [Propioniciclava sp.]